MTSDNLQDWTFIGDVLHPEFDEDKPGVAKSDDISCPNMFRLGGKWMLVCIIHKPGCRYFIGDFKNEQFLPEHHAVLGGNSRRYFAPESLLTPDGRRVNWSWYLGGEMKGVQSLPTELELPSDGVMLIRPIRELESLRHDEQAIQNLTLRKNTPHELERIKGQHLELKVDVAKSGGHNFGVDVLCDEMGQSGLRIEVDRDNNLLKVGRETAPFTLRSDEALTLRIFVDATLVEVFATSGRSSWTTSPEPPAPE